MAKNRDWRELLNDAQGEKNILRRVAQIIYGLCRMDSRLRKLLRELKDFGYGLTITITPTYQPGLRVTLNEAVTDSVAPLPITKSDEKFMKKCGIAPQLKEVADGYG